MLERVKAVREGQESRLRFAAVLDQGPWWSERRGGGCACEVYKVKGVGGG